MIMNKKANLLLQQGVGIILFILIVFILFQAGSNIIGDSKNTDLLLDYNNLLEEATTLNVGESINALLSLPPNSALISMNAFANFVYEQPDYGVSSSGWFRGNVFDRPSLCARLESCTCLCAGFNPHDTSRGEGFIQCDNLVCFNGNYSWEDSVSMQEVFPEASRENTFIASRQNHYWKNSSIIIRSDHITNETMRVTRYTQANIGSPASAGANQVVPIISGWQGLGNQQLLDVTIIKVEEPNVVRLCFKDSC